MKNLFSLGTIFLCVLLFVTSCSKKKEEVHYQTVDFESLTVPSSGYWNGSDAAGYFISSDVKFENQYNTAWQTWAGFSYSQKNDVTTAGYDNQYSVVDPANQNNKFGLFYPSFGGDLFASLSMSGEFEPKSIDLCNTTYTALSLKNGDTYSKKFGGNTGNDPDWYKVTISGFDRNNTKTGSIDLYLADFRFTDATKDYILTKWTTFDLTSLGKVYKIALAFSSSDAGVYGINTPTYVCLDNFKYKNESIIL
jgi:hypothetical protein